MGLNLLHTHLMCSMLTYSAMWNFVYGRPLDYIISEVSDNRLQESANMRKPFSVVSPVEGHTKLRLEVDGLQVLRRLRGPVAPMVVIGPYRSGKSFLLNQILGVNCGEGFGVGHTRSTQTKGIWVWGEPLEVQRQEGQPPLQLLLFDTEGLEATGVADAHDDRIFALSAIISSVLVYNLAETVRESDVQELSFAVQLAEGFYANSQEGHTSPVEAANMLWLIQRDFLEGVTVQQMVNAALEPVSNPKQDADIEQVNRIRQSLRIVAQNSTAFGLTQPHLERTRLCELQDADLEPSYISQRTELRKLIRKLSKPKALNGKELSGAELADLIERMVSALNARDIPSAGSILEHFNKDLVNKVSEQYAQQIDEQELPVEEDVLDARHIGALANAMQQFDAEKFGNEEGASTSSLREVLRRQIEQILATKKTANTLASAARCQDLEAGCEDDLEQQQRTSLPSTGRFTAHYRRCREQFNATCVGPGRSRAEERLEKAWLREMNRFKRDYNDKLYNGLVLVMLVDILVFRFFLRSSALETLGWLGFVLLQVYPKLFLSGGSMYDSHWWQVLVHSWELVVYNPLLDLEHTWQLLLGVVVLLYVTWRLWISCPIVRWKRKGDKKLRLPNEPAERNLDV